MGVLANDSLHVMEVGRTKSRPSIHNATEIGAILLFDRGPRLKRDMSHRAVNGDRDRGLGGVAREDYDVLMESDTPITISRRAHGCGRGDGRCHAPTVEGHRRTRAVFLKKHFAMLRWNIFPIDSVEILTFRASGILAPPSRLKVLDLSRGVLTNARLVCIGAANNKFTMVFSSPRMR